MGSFVTKARDAGFVAALLLGLAAAPADAQVRCGDVIGPNETVTLQQNVEQCGAGPAALTVIGPATLDLNGFAVICSELGVNTADGIVIVGKRATVRNGSVQHCARGVSVLGEGSHRVEGVTAALSGDGFGPHGEGFVVESDRNLLLRNSAVQNAAEGFRLIEADRNKLIENNSFFNSMGFELFIGVRNVLEGNRANDNELYGFHLDSGPFTPGGGRNKVRSNTAFRNQQGFYIDGEDGDRIQDNVAQANRVDGFFLIFGRKNRLLGNRSEDNGESGIVVASANDTLISRNTSLNNDQADDDVRSFDMLESLTDCGTNRWIGNVFVTKNEACIR